MKTLWTYSHTAPVHGLRVGPDGGIVLLDAIGGHVLLGLDGTPVDGSRRPRVADLARSATRRGPYDIVTDDDRLTLLLDGTELEGIELDGTVTAVAAARDGAMVLAGTEEGTVYGLRLPLTEAGAMTLLDKEQDLLRHPDATTARRAAHLYLDTGSPCFAVRRVRRLGQRGALPSGSVEPVIAGIALQHGRVLRRDPGAAFEAGRALSATGEDQAAVGLLQRAAADPRFRSRALYTAGECFRRLGAESAAAIAHEQAAASGPGEDEKRVLYDLARALQEQDRHTEAVDRFESLLAWDATYEDAWQRYEHSRNRARSAGPAVGRRSPVGSAAGLVRDLEARGLLGRTDSRIESYDATFYVQFDHTGVHDSVKKRLEMVQLLTAVEDPGAVAASLDVGSGTLRYPQVLDRFGVWSYGIDLSDAGIHACVDARWARRFAVADGTAMPFRDGSFDLVTCMMGTVNHLSAAQRERFLAESFRTLRPGGRLVVSAWDPACRFQTFLSFYSPAEMAQLRRRLTEPRVLREECAAAGFSAVRTTPFCTFPDWLATGADASGTSGADRLTWLADLDRDRVAGDPATVGQMFLLSARR
ncbi:Ubiquinone/menaquinone biosynthesis C-methylase UbiE [Streptomyces sp. MnatMP-M77]|uniref:class I SAM-dependent methyltransferase n=1 Tax=unclassified Streptomyces TaxID=2593676 RepID=UPI0008057452|nr:class I SAM-dependent methyltransferase [Streptomyces sp. MnatMP-M77]MYT78944.1 methyltransferase domain-containing protein [Streptomyces sp. SID8364]SBU94016.1 Ubiquinone/menaquinone biosynthesis C-methylase UbiE [Streptomyces sp. MnatMP-M77]